MISSISIENIALIDNVEINLTEGLNILSGETGAGKSIIIDSINFVLGERADRSLIRHGKSHAVVEVVFDTGNAATLDMLEELGFERDGTIVVTRKMSAEGKSECRINRKQVPLQTLRTLVSGLVDLHAQHEHQSLMNASNHISLLDGYGGYDEELKKFRALYDEYSDIKNQLAVFPEQEERERRIDILKYETSEIEKAELKEGEEESLIQLRSRLNNVERILSATEGAIASIDNEETGATLAVTRAISYIKNILSYDESLSDVIDRLDSVKIELGDIEETLKSSVDPSAFDSNSLIEVEKRLSLIRSLKRKYGATVEEMEAFYEKESIELNRLLNAEEEIEKLEKALSKVEKSLVKAADKLYELRQTTSEEFSEKIIKNLVDLGMKNSRFRVAITHKDDPSEYHRNGADTVEFLISANLGEPLKPLSKIASGGELSRFMLGLKNIVAETDGIDTLIFDEIDTGISGNIAKVVGEKLAEIASVRQVIAVTHLAQIAVMADTHYLIEKYSDGDKTSTNVYRLNEEEVVKEIIRLTGGNTDSDISLMHAKELLGWAKSKK